MIKYKDLVEGEFYYQKNKKQFGIDYSFITQFFKDYNDKYIVIEQNKYLTGGTSSDVNTIRKATNYEKQWLLTCIKANKYIEKSNNINIPNIIET